MQRGSGRDRHGRGIRSSATGPFLPPLNTRIDLFDMTVASTVDYLRSVWPDSFVEESNIAQNIAVLRKMLVRFSSVTTA